MPLVLRSWHVSCVILCCKKFLRNSSRDWQPIDIQDSVRKAALEEYFKLQHKVTKAFWDETSGKWTISGHGPQGTFTDSADIFINAMGCLNLWKWPDLPGREQYRGLLYHSAQWPSGAEEKLDGKTVAVIGNGASAVQM